LKRCLAGGRIHDTAENVQSAKTERETAAFDQLLVDIEALLERFYIPTRFSWRTFWDISLSGKI